MLVGNWKESSKDQIQNYFQEWSAQNLYDIRSNAAFISRQYALFSISSFRRLSISMKNIDFVHNQAEFSKIVSQNKLPQLILGYIYILKYLQSNFIG